MIEWKDNNPVVSKTRFISADGKWEKTSNDGYVDISISDYIEIPHGFATSELGAWKKLLKSCDATIHELTELRAEAADIIAAQGKK
jgi:hypothetical protein